MKKPHIITREDFNDFVVTQVIASDSDSGKRLSAVWDIDADINYFQLFRKTKGKYVPEKKFAVLDEAIDAYNDFKGL
ncbi:hypothetical protein H6F86_21035 [Phormidium sp. FACHB-592]|uniref:Uncharacterized protein n=1 Tax=Stenomitos frigidus AS-A4 TaxID=2933935 RepID=A0ABV0KEP8_9CYAN|nr:hypothetical protein [Phormidium sp. FACHB-592]MBD2076320.1 hypothetical protein [Phormidium sp. FACHB-592]